MNQFFSLFFKSSIAVFFGVCLLWQPSNAQSIAPTIEWQRSLGGTKGDEATSISQTSDGGYIIAGLSYSIDGDVSDHHGFGGFIDYWVVKLTNAGAMEWQRSLGGSDNDYPTSISQTTDGGYIVAGWSKSADGNVTGNHGERDFWIVKLTSAGAIEWEKSLGGSGDDEAASILQTTDGGYVVAGRSRSDDGDVIGHHGATDSSDAWIVKLTNTGGMEWQKSLGGSGTDGAASIEQTSDGGYIIAGSSQSTNGDGTGHHGLAEYSDAWIVKLTGAGGIEWQQSLGGSNHDYGNAIEQTTDGGYIVAGSSRSNDGDVSGNRGGGDSWIIKLTSAGAIDWQRSLGGSDADGGTSIKQTADGGYIVAGFSESTDGNATGWHEGMDYLIVKLTNTGVIEWQQLFGGRHDDYAISIKQTTDNGYIVAGYSQSHDGDVTNNHGSAGSSDAWIVKLAPPNSTGVKPTAPPIPNPWAMNANYPNPFSSTTTITFTVPERSFVRLSVDTEQGVEVARLIEEQLEAGEYRVPFSADGLASGTYLYRLSSGSTSLVGKMTIVR